MPKAVVSVEAKRYDLTTCQDGFVSLKKLSYGELLHSRQLAQTMEMSDNDGGGPKGQLTVNLYGVAAYDFAHSIIEHNLEDADGRQLNFQNVADVMNLDPVIAQEVEKLIDDLNGGNETAVNKNAPLSSTSAKPSVPKEEPSV